MPLANVSPLGVTVVSNSPDSTVLEAYASPKIVHASQKSKFMKKHYFGQ